MHKLYTWLVIALLFSSIISTVAQSNTKPEDRKPRDKLREAFDDSKIDSDTKQRQKQRGKETEDAFKSFQNRSDDKNPLKRKIEIENEQNAVIIKSKMRTNEDRAEYKFSFRYGGFPFLRVEYRNKSSDVKSRYSLAVGFLQLVEFSDTVSASSSPSRVNLTRANGDWTVTQSSDTFQGAAVTAVNATWKSKTSPLTFSVEMYALSEAVMNGTALSPNNLKYSIWISGYNYTLQNSKLGIVHFARTKSVQKTLNGELALGGGNISWATIVAVGGNTANVVRLGDVKVDESLTQNGTEPKADDEKDNVFVLAFDSVQPKTIYWDPTVTVSDPELEAVASGGQDKPQDKPKPSNAGRFSINMSLLIFSLLTFLVM